MKLELGGGENDAPQKVSGNGDIVSNMERALENPQVQQMLQAVLQSQGIDPAQMGMATDGGQQQTQPAMPENSENSAPSEMPENSGEHLLTIDSADEIIEFIDQISAMSPTGDKTQLGTIKSHVQANKDQIEARLNQ